MVILATMFSPYTPTTTCLFTVVTVVPFENVQTWCNMPVKQTGSLKICLKTFEDFRVGCTRGESDENISFQGSCWFLVTNELFCRASYLKLRQNSSFETKNSRLCFKASIDPICPAIRFTSVYPTWRILFLLTSARLRLLYSGRKFR